MNKKEVIKRIEAMSFRDKTFKEIKAEVAKIISEIDQPQQVVVPAFIDSFIRYAKTKGMSLFIAMDNAQNKESEWIITNEETFARAWLDGYEIEKEQLYTVELFNGQPLVEVNNVLYFSSDLVAPNARVSKDKLELAGFGWVFDCDGVKVVEVE
ncbi:TPA: DUF1642 domain-containing protein [Streptococcus suis]|nr:DUF1642 domain-containing protein [Streptococcus suis]HEM3714722.1 DUF1642 domain-containing protein [Streptococcus suis]